MHGQWTVIAPLHALTSLDSHLDPSQHDLCFGAAHSEHCPGLGQSELRDLPNTFLCGMFPPYLPCLSMVLLRLQSARTANSCSLLLLKINQQSQHLQAPLSCRNCENQWEFLFYSPSLSFSAKQATSTNLTCHFPQEVLKCKDTSVFYTNYNGNVDLGVTEALGI